jgi:hypothetical protein
MLGPALVLVSSMTREALERGVDELADLARRHRLAIAGAGASERLAERIGCRFLAGDPVSAAASASAEPGTP